jgi:hypothetical protein
MIITALFVIFCITILVQVPSESMLAKEKGLKEDELYKQGYKDGILSSYDAGHKQGYIDGYSACTDDIIAGAGEGE